MPPSLKNGDTVRGMDFGAWYGVYGFLKCEIDHYTQKLTLKP